QAEDGIRDRNVTGVQTCALPIFIAFVVAADEYDVVFPTQGFSHSLIERPTLRTHQYDAWIAEVKSIHGIEDGLGLQDHACPATRSEERRVGKESSCRSRQSHKSR